ncbi:RAMP superfamily CRISPR-associated protein [Rhodococcus sp. NPDC003318]|uniref:RAMP superfamily CRISPR-associated protein n=1 Tax=Rhodococcus sp. NPDC003318 TaxID=3364503 RepID=UPI00368FEFFD
MSVSVRWDLAITARSPISHRAETIGTTATLRRMKVLAADGTVDLVPVVSGNSLRGVLRRLGEELLRDVLGYEGLLPLAVAHALRNGGAITRTSAEPVTGRRLRELRTLVPQLSVFGGAVGAAPIDGCLRVGHVVPVIEEARPLLRGHYPNPLPTRLDVEALESYSHLDDPANPAADTNGTDEARSAVSLLMRYEVETITAGTRFESWVHLDRGSDLDHAFLADVLAEYVRRGWLGGRVGIGHGDVATTITADSATGPGVDWRAHLIARRDAALALLQSLPA